MKVKVLASGAGLGPHGVVMSWPPNGVVEVDDGDGKAVAFYRQRVDAGMFELLEDVEALEPPPPHPPPAVGAKASAKAERSPHPTSSKSASSKPSGK